MKLEEYERRRRVIAVVQEKLQLGGKVPVWGVTVRDAPSSEPADTAYSVTPTTDGLWRGDYWYSESGGTHPIESVTATSAEAAIDWAWWVATRDYVKKYVISSEQQEDRRTLATWASLAEFGAPGSRADYAKLARSHWADTTTNPVLLGAAAIVLGGRHEPIAMRLARNPRTPRGALALLARTTYPAARWQLAGNPSTPPRVVERLRVTADFGVRWYLARRPETTTAEVVGWSHQDSALWTMVLERPDIAPDDLVRLDEESSGAFRVRLVAHPTTPPRLLSVFAHESDHTVGLALLESGRLPAADVGVTLERSAGWSSYLLGWSIPGRSLPLDASVVPPLVASEVLQHRLIAAAAASLSSGDLRALASDSSLYVRVVIARRPDLPAGLVESLAADQEPTVRASLASNTAIDGSVIGRLAHDGNRTVWDAALRNRSIPREVLEALQDSSDVMVARAAKGTLRGHR